MDDSTLSSQLAAYIAANILKQPRRIIQPDEALISSGLVDSFHLVDLAVMVETQYGVILDDNELKAEVFDTLRQLAALIRSRLG